jgi:hypothetical protein
MRALLDLLLNTEMFPKINPIIPTRRFDFFDTHDWVYEVKYDGFRALAGRLDDSAVINVLAVCKTVGEYFSSCRADSKRYL